MSACECCSCCCGNGASPHLSAASCLAAAPSDSPGASSWPFPPHTPLLSHSSTPASPLPDLPPGLSVMLVAPVHAALPAAYRSKLSPLLVSDPLPGWRVMPLPPVHDSLTWHGSPSPPSPARRAAWSVSATAHAPCGK
eukprot:1145804-Pelagomonas_calceolata.AAC.2